MRRQKLERENQDLISELENLTVIQDQFESLQDEARSASDQVNSLTQRLSQNASRLVERSCTGLAWLAGPTVPVCNWIFQLMHNTTGLLIIAPAVENSEEVLPLYHFTSVILFDGKVLYFNVYNSILYILASENLDPTGRRA